MVLTPENRQTRYDDPLRKEDLTPLKIEQSQDGKITILTITGPINSTTAGEFGEVMHELIDGENGRGADTRIQIDFTYCTRMSSAGFRELISVLIRIRNYLGVKSNDIKPISINIARANEDVQSAFNIAGLDDGDILPLIQEEETD